jgi:hypothetical protein
VNVAEDGTTINSLHSEIARLNGELAKVRAEAKDNRLKKNRASTELEAAKAALAGLEKDRDGWKTKAEAAPSDLQAKVDELTGKLRGVNHRAAFDKLAKAANVRPEAVQDLYDLTKYAPDADEVDEAKITTLIGEAVQSRPYLLGEEKAPDGASTQPGAATNGAVRLGNQAPPPGSALGTQDTASGRFVVRERDLKDAGWMFQNQSRIAEARRAGTLVMAP